MICIYQLLGHRPQNFLKNPCFHFFPLKSQCDQSWPCRKIGQGQPKVMIYINCDGPVPDATYQVSLKSSHRFQWRSFIKVFTIYGHGSHLGHVTWTIYANLNSPFLRMLHMKFSIDWARGFRGEDLWKVWTTTTTVTMTVEHGHPISSPFEPSAQVS